MWGLSEYTGVPVALIKVRRNGFGRISLPRLALRIPAYKHTIQYISSSGISVQVYI